MGGFFYTYSMRILVNGCSFTRGLGFESEDQAPEIWPNLLCQKTSAPVTNIAKSGSSNLEIFLSTLRELQEREYDLVIVQWTELRRTWLEPGLDRRYVCATPPRNFHTIKEAWQHHDMHLSVKQRRQFEETLLMLTGDYRACHDLVTYCNTLQQIHPKIIFINGLVPWTQDLVELKTPWDLAASMSGFTRDMLEFDHKSDEEIRHWWQQLHDRMSLVLPFWANPFESWFDNQIDLAPAGHHPGPLGHQWIFDKIWSHMVDRKFTSV